MKRPEAWLEIYRATNGAAADRMLWLEPWAEEFMIPPGSELVLGMKGADPTALEIEQLEGRIVVWAPANALIRVEIDGFDRSIGSSELAVPDTEHLSTRQFLEIGVGNLPEARVGGKPIPPRRLGWLKRVFDWI